MTYKTFADVSFEMRRLRRMIIEKRVEEVNKIYNRVLDSLRVDKSEVKKAGDIVLYSKECSYSIMSCYLLLDMIDRNYDGYGFVKDEDEHNYFLFEELEVGEPGEMCELEDIEVFLEKLKLIFRINIDIFLVPYKSENKYIIKEAQQSNLIILYSDSKENVIDSFLDAVSELYKKKNLGLRLPNWAINNSEFKKEIVAWFKGEPSKFK